MTETAARSLSIHGLEMQIAMSSAPTDTTSPLTMDVGDAIMWKEQIVTEDGEFEFKFEWGAVMEQKSLENSTTISVHRLTQDTNTKLWFFSDPYWVDVPCELVEQFQCINGDDGNAPRAWDVMGFRMIDGGTLVKHSDEVGNHLFPVGDAAFEVVSDSDESEGSLQDFVVPDEECEPFTHAKTDFAKETHLCVREFNKWAPKDERESAMKAFIIRQEKMASQLDDNARFKRGMQSLDYNQPND